MEQIRTFIAIELPDELKRALTRLESALKAGDSPGVKWVDPYSIHLTLKFLGNVVAGRIDEITRAMTEAAKGIPPFTLTVTGLGVFPNRSRIQVAWVGVTGDLDNLLRLQQNLESSLARLNFPPESRPFTPHLTLARVRNEVTFEERQRLGQIITSTKFDAAHVIKVEAINLMRSQLTRQGAIYSRIASVVLNESA
ncbi:MAG: RNA 2',3'-cyclic phosphodiesterase [Dehalococcoidales bacterium]|nr:RNA 2',3'-cyclic phosphodiesterase [Dehalococcoidales bacterium]